MAIVIIILVVMLSWLLNVICISVEHVICSRRCIQSIMYKVVNGKSDELIGMSFLFAINLVYILPAALLLTLLTGDKYTKLLEEQ